MNTTCVKLLLYTFNVLCFIFALFLFTASIVLSVFLAEIHQINYSPLGAAIVLVIIGFGLCVLCIFGFCAVAKESSGWLYIYAIALAFAFVIQLVTGAVLLAYYAQFHEDVQADLAHALRYYKWAEDRRYDPLTRSIDRLQDDWTCCGIRSLNDWDQVFNSPFPGKYPGSCCGRDYRGDYATPCEIYEVANRPGCFSRIELTMNVLLSMAGIIAIVMGVAYLLAIFLALYLAREIYDRKEDDRSVTPSERSFHYNGSHSPAKEIPTGIKTPMATSGLHQPLTGGVGGRQTSHSTHTSIHQTRVMKY